MAERVGFEPTKPFSLPDFKAGTINLSDISPYLDAGMGFEPIEYPGQSRMPYLFGDPAAMDGDKGLEPSEYWGQSPVCYLFTNPHYLYPVMSGRKLLGGAYCK